MPSSLIADRMLRLPLPLLHAQVFLLVFQSFPVHETIAEAAGPAVFIIGPCLHPTAVRFLYAGIHTVKPLFAHILCGKPASGMHKKASHAGIPHQPDLTP